MKFVLPLLLVLILACSSPKQSEQIVTTPTRVELKTTHGTIVLELSDKTPLHRDNFIQLVQEKAYDSLLFHRVVSGFVIQAGDPESKYATMEDQLGEGDRDYLVPAEFDTSLYHKRGALGAARDPNPERASSAMQFYIVQRGPQTDSLIEVGERRINGWLAEHAALNAPENRAFRADYGAAVSEAAELSGQQVFVVGGANSAGQGAMFLSRYASKVIMLIRGESLQKGMSQYLIDQIRNTKNIEVWPHTSIQAVQGEKSLESVTLFNSKTGEQKEFKAAAVFIFIGARAHTDVFQDVVACDENGFVLTGPDLAVDGVRPMGWRLDRDPYLNETSVPGIFAAGDVRAGVVRRVASAVGQGSVTVSFVHEYLKTV